MKPRVQIDTLLMIAAIVLTAVLYALPNFYAAPAAIENVFDFLGYMVILKGVMIRMSARGHKKAFSRKSESLVTTGPYRIVRNPMYLGSFLIGAGFVFILWPWWGIPLFAWAFYTRFKRQIAYEEEILSRMFSSQYTAYCHLTPRVFPHLHSVVNVRTRDVFNLEESFSTKEKWGLFSWPVLALALEYAQSAFISHQIHWGSLLWIFFSAVVTFVVVFIIMYWVK